MLAPITFPLTPYTKSFHFLKAASSFPFSPVYSQTLGHCSSKKMSPGTPLLSYTSYKIIPREPRAMFCIVDICMFTFVKGIDTKKFESIHSKLFTLGIHFS